MPTIACHTLGCKVNQYDTQAMLELFLSSGYREVPFSEDADVYLINTCTVTGTGDRKSLQLARRMRRLHPTSKLILCGCMAQNRSDDLLAAGADLVLGTQHRSQVVEFLNRVIRTGHPLSAVAPFPDGVPFETLRVSSQSDHTRAILKIQEGCGNCCTYCIIPSVRGPVRSRPPEEIRQEGLRLCAAGFREIVVTGIHLTSYGRDFPSETGLAQALQILQDLPGILRIRLGSLEPCVIRDSFMEAVSGMDKLCPQFHLALQSGSDSVLRRMKRRYNTEQYLESVRKIRAVYPHAAITTDILTGFPGETDKEYEETCSMIRRVGFSRIHVFPYSRRPGTPADRMPDQLPRRLREERARKLIDLGREVGEAYLRSWIGLESILLPEEIIDGCWEGYTPEYIRVRLPASENVTPGLPVRVKLTQVLPLKMSGSVLISKF